MFMPGMLDKTFGPVREHHDGVISARQVVARAAVLFGGHGDLLAMDPPTNDRWTHSVPVRKGVKAPRLNLTFRRLVPERAAAVAARAARRRAAKEKAALAEG